MICRDIHRALVRYSASYDADQIVIVCDEVIAFETKLPILRIAASEGAKTIETAARIWDFLFAHHITRRGLLVAIGGGMITDIAGFAAGTYKRGIDYLNIPTTLLAMVDASSGGKTGVNYHGLKNSIGLFAEPIDTLICPEWLQTLPAQQWLNGFAEMLKTGLIDPSRNLWPQLLQYDLERMEREDILPLIEQCIAIKEAVVKADPQEKGMRKVLNLGHSFGHALEEINLGAMPHGYAVLYGLIAELYLSVTKLHCPQAPLQQLTQLMLHYYGKPQCKCSESEALIRLMLQDKKNEHADQINCTLLSDIGAPRINQAITTDEAHEAIDYLLSL